jgi:AmmeMemoRadiSam system protein A
MTLQVSRDDGLFLLETAREAIAARLAGRQPRFPSSSSPAVSMPCGAFVTLKVREDLRGCIGHITACRPLVDTVKETAVSSAFDDPRFPPLGPDEWPLVRIEISVLSPFELVRDPRGITVGTHGIMVRNGHKSGLLLPQVATEQGWDREAFLAHACRKAGLPVDAWRSPQTRIEVFTATVFRESREQGSHGTRAE